eukprot:TRINITY_DN7477_c0_g1_i1.p1 TRINITY_DN7477_c0_g1~~TRINITY_DN7477_c0_g1_i1.p1  ORF type:complete len:133 (+),score=20.81 TRINITY_DN7477_c0_g1_i1:91-489(+)
MSSFGYLKAGGVSETFAHLVRKKSIPKILKVIQQATYQTPVDTQISEGIQSDGRLIAYTPPFPYFGGHSGSSDFSDPENEDRGQYMDVRVGCGWWDYYGRPCPNCIIGQYCGCCDGRTCGIPKKKEWQQPTS